MPRPSRLQSAKDDILALFEAAPIKVYAPKQLGRILADHRHQWRLANVTKAPDFIAFLKKYGALREHKLRSINYVGDLNRYTWGKASPYEVALSIKPNAYVTHGTAAALHGLLRVDSKTILINVEQSEKPPLSGTLTQEGINRAFAGSQRTSKLIYAYGKVSIVQLAGKHTGQLGVEQVSTAKGPIVRATDLERTLIDIVVRPAYAGGPDNILKAYRAAKKSVSPQRLLKTLEKLDYAYPYHQSIGFLMEASGYPPSAYEPLRALGLHHDFYLAHQMEESIFSKEWRLYYPADLLTHHA